jgi:hypothetical protein
VDFHVLLLLFDRIFIVIMYKTGFVQLISTKEYF